MYSLYYGYCSSVSCVTNGPLGSRASSLTQDQEAPAMNVASNIQQAVRRHRHVRYEDAQHRLRSHVLHVYH